MKKSCSFVLLSLFFCLALPALGDTVHVDASYTGSTELGSETQPFKSIQAAIDSAIPVVDSVRVKAGTYYESIDLLSGIDVVGDGYETVIIHGSYTGRCVTADHISNVLLKGFMITGGAAPVGGGIGLDGSALTVEACLIYSNSASWGGGIYLVDSDLTVEECTVSTNNAPAAGAGIAALRSTLTVENSDVRYNICQNFGGGLLIDTNSTARIDRCSITDNTAIEGGGIYWKLSHGSVRRSLIAGNKTTFNGAAMFVDTSRPKITRTLMSVNQAVGGFAGGVYFYESSEAAGLYNCVIDGNSSSYPGGAILCDGSSPTITNNTVVSNTGYLDDGGLVALGTSNPVVLNCILWGNGGDLVNATADYCQVQNGGDSGTHNSSANPLFTNAVEGDYTFQPNSPCRDTGHPDPSFNDPDGTRNDRGAYGGPYAPIAADADDNGRVDIVDLVFVRNNINKDPQSDCVEGCDVNRDGKINILDLVFVRNHLNEGASTPQWP